MKNSRAKGKRAELEVAHFLQEHGFDARRGQQYCGANGDADVVGLPGIHIEVKRTEAFRLWDAIDQAKSDAKTGEIPAVFHRKNGKKWCVVMDAEDFLKLYDSLSCGVL